MILLLKPMREETAIELIKKSERKRMRLVQLKENYEKKFTRTTGQGVAVF